MRRFEYLTLDVFTDRPFGGNPLAVFPDAFGLSDVEMQSLSAEMNLSETTFVLPSERRDADANVRIFNRTAEMPFAGHPNVGTAVALDILGRADGDVLRFDEKAGMVDVTLMRDSQGVATGASIIAPRPLETLGTLSSAAIADCLDLTDVDILVDRHAPTIASVGVDFVLVEVTADSLGRASPRLEAYRRAHAASGIPSDRLSIFIYSRSESEIRSRMFAPMAGTWEDPATGSANAALAALLLQIDGGDELAYDAVQGVEMGRPSRLALRAWRSAEGVRASVGGTCIPMFRGRVELD